jgi:zinc transport system substrate-binding protein
LDEEIRSSLKDVKTRYYVAFHDAFAYFAERYGLTLLAAIEEVPGRDPSPRHLARVSDLIRAHGVRSLFSPAGPLPRIVRSLAEDLGLKVYPLDPIETGPLHPEGYERLVRGNLRLIVEALNR